MSNAEALVLNSVAINDGTNFTLEALDMTPPDEAETWISGADSDGAILMREPKVSNRTITASIRIEPQTTMNAALGKIASILDQLKEAQRNTTIAPLGVPLTWVPATSTLPTITFRCLSGQITGLPIDITNGWLVQAPLITVKMTCLPFGEGTESSLASTTSSAPLITQEVTSVGGDVDALARLVVTDAASKDRRYMVWGMESRFYPTSSPPSLIVDSTSMVTSGFAGSTATNSSAYSGSTNNVIRMSVRTQLQAVCGLGNLAHVGAFRPRLRFNVSATTIALRLSYRALDNPLRPLSFQIPVVVGWNDVDLGSIQVPQAVAGTQRWTGQIEAYSMAAGGETLDVDVMWIMPAERFGRARSANYTYTPGVISAYDDFVGTSSGSNLSARTAPLGGSWATSGATTDFKFADAPAATDETVQRNTTTSETLPGRVALLGTTSFAAVEAGVRTYTTDLLGSRMLLIRYVDTSNYCRIVQFPESEYWGIQIFVAGVVTNLGGFGMPGVDDNAWFGMRAVAYATGKIVAWLLDANGVIINSISAQHAALATGGALATGKVGFADANDGAGPVTRYYDAFYAGAPAPETIVDYSGQSIEFRSDTVVREDSSGTYYGQAPEYVGSRFFIPPAGGPGRKARIAVLARRNDLETAADNDLTSNATMDSTTVQILATPRYLVVPR